MTPEEQKKMEEEWKAKGEKMGQYWKAKMNDPEF